MISEREKALVAALRSGKYEQATQVLRSGNQYCCLGVACDISGLGIWKPIASGGWNFENSLDSYDFNYTSLPEFMMEHLEWYENGELSIRDRDNEQLNLACLNDHGFTFDQIADVIEAGLVLRNDFSPEPRYYD